MTNSDKAIEITVDITYHRQNQPVYFDAIKEAALEMAEWKDKQFREYLVKKKYNYMLHREMWQQDSFEWGCYDSQIDTIDEIINELFKE